jgi:hypothetical protein
VVPEYPLFGYWARPIVGYGDANGDGRLQASEIVLADSAAFLGVPEPKYEAGVHSSLGLFRGALTLDAGLAYQHGLTQQNQVLRQSQALLRGANDPSAPLDEQAAAIALSSPGNSTEYGLFQTVSIVRFTSLSIAYNLPPAIAGRLGARAMTIAVQGSNLGLWTSYRGKDPDVNGAGTGNQVTDTGVLPQPRLWQLRVNVSY